MVQDRHQWRIVKKEMQIFLVKPRGFCAGVNMAISALEHAVERFGTPFYVYHEIVHNTWVVERFRQQGVIFVDSIEMIPDQSRLMISAHGAAPEIREQALKRGLLLIDATCPLVRKVHDEVRRFADKGYEIVLIGHPGHDEVVAVLAEVPGKIHLIADERDIDTLQFPADTPIAYAKQTTLSVFESAKIVERLQQKFPDIVGPSVDDICYATQNRQEAVQLLAPKVDMVLVVGSKNSSNSRRLAEIASSLGVQSSLIDGPDDIDSGQFRGDERVMITAGASAPESVVQDCLTLLVGRFDATIEEVTVRQESLQFALPRELRATTTI